MKIMSDDSCKDNSHIIYLHNNVSNMAKVSRFIERRVTVRHLFPKIPESGKHRNRPGTCVPSWKDNPLDAY